MISSIDSFRVNVVLKSLTNLNSLQSSWPSWKPQIDKLIQTPNTEDGIYQLGSNLANIFRSNVVTGRSNSAVSSGGAAWEGLICWYLNLVFFGTDVLVVKPTLQQKPRVIDDATTVNIGNQRTNTESDLVAFSVPNNHKVSDNIIDINKNVEENLSDTDLTIIQCKTNWNDNAQIPMLWDLIYFSNSFRLPNVSVGTNGVTPNSFRKFSYSFMTVPTVNTNFSAESLAVLRVKNLSGGNYWGRPSLNGVAKSISEFFTTNFGNHFNGSIQQSIKKNILNHPKVFENFLNLTT